jgi:hypothetical protein
MTSVNPGFVDVVILFRRVPASPIEHVIEKDRVIGSARVIKAKVEEAVGGLKDTLRGE